MGPVHGFRIEAFSRLSSQETGLALCQLEQLDLAHVVEGVLNVSGRVLRLTSNVDEVSCAQSFTYKVGATPLAVPSASARDSPACSSIRGRSLDSRILRTCTTNRRYASTT